MADHFPDTPEAAVLFTAAERRLLELAVNKLAQYAWAKPYFAGIFDAAEAVEGDEP